MKRATLSGRDRRALLLGLAMLALALLYRVAVKPYAEALADTRDRAAIEGRALAREQALLSLAPRQDAIRRTLDSVVSASRDRLFGAADDGIAAAEVGTYLTTLARSHNVWLRAAEPRDSKTSPSGVRALPVDIHAESDFEGVRSFLHALERGTKLLRVDHLTITPGADSSAARPVMQLRATVTGYALRNMPVPAPASRSERP